MSARMRILIALAVLLGATAWSSLFYVQETHQALVLQFGDPRRAIPDPGLHVKLPFIQNVVPVDRRILNLDIDPEEVIAFDQKRLVVDAFVRYRITDTLKFYQTLQTSARIDSRLTALTVSNLRSVLGRQNFRDIISARRAALMLETRALVNAQAGDFGIEIVDLRIRRADLPTKNSVAVFRRMQAERQQDAAEIRAIGQRDSQQIRSGADREAVVILATAYRDAEIIRGQGDGCRNRIFASAFGQDAEFFNFYRSMQSYERALEGGGGTSLVLSPDSEFFQFLLDPGLKEKESPPPVNSRTRRPATEVIAEDLRALCPEIPELEKDIPTPANGVGEAR